MTRILALILALLAPGFALAQGGDSNKAQAKALYKEGKAHYGARRYGKAVRAFSAANTLRPHPLMLYNIASAYEEMTDLASAEIYYKQYLASKPDDARTVKRDLKKLQRKLASGWAKVKVTSTPPGASVWRGDQSALPIASTPATILAPIGVKGIVFSLKGYESVTRTVTVELGKTAELSVALPKALPKIQITTQPAGAVVGFDDNEGPSGQTPLLHGLKAGAHVAHIALQGFDPVDHAFTLTEAHRDAPLTPELIMLRKALPSGLVEITVNLDGAMVKVDGKVVGTSPFDAPIRLPEGLHTLEVTHPKQAEPNTEKVAVVAGKTTRTNITIQTSLISADFELDQRFWSYGLMGLGGALVIGGGITGAMALSDHGSLSDCRDDVTCVGTSKESALADDVESGALTTDILMGVGLATVASGLFFYLTADEKEAPSGTMGVTPIAGGAAAFGQFEF